MLIWRPRSNLRIFPFNLPLIWFTRILTFLVGSILGWSGASSPICSDFKYLLTSTLLTWNATKASCKHTKSKGRGRENKSYIPHVSLLCTARLSLWRNHNSKDGWFTFLSPQALWPFSSRVCPVFLQETLFQLANGRGLTSTTAITTGMQAP